MRGLRLIPVVFLLSALAGCETIYEETVHAIDAARTVAKVGVLANLELEWAKSAGPFEKALRYFRQEGADAVLIVGDPTKDGASDQYRVFEAVVRKVYPEFGTADSPVRLLVATNGYERFEVNGFVFAAQEPRPREAQRELTFYSAGKVPLTDDYDVYPRSRRVIAAGSMRGVRVAGGCEELRPPKGKGQKPAADSAAQGLLVQAYADEVVVNRLDFTPAMAAGRKRAKKDLVYAESVAPPLVYPRVAPRVPQDDPPPTPRFWDDFALRVIRGVDAAGARLYTLRWPVLTQANAGVRATSYEVVAALERPAGSGKRVRFLRKTLVSPAFFRSETREGGPMEVTFTAAQLHIREGEAAEDEVLLGLTPIGTAAIRGETSWVRLTPTPGHGTDK